MEAKDKFQISLDSAFYLLKHFDGITIEELEELEKAGKLIDDINKQFRVIGSKFDSAHISGYRELLELINTNEPTDVIEQINGRKAFIFNFNHEIGTDFIQNTRALSTLQKSQIITDNRLGYSIRCIKMKAQHTKQLVVVTEGLNLITSYPGTYAPPLPKDTMDAALFEQCSRFWENHVFIIQ